MMSIKWMMRYVVHPNSIVEIAVPPPQLFGVPQYTFGVIVILIIPYNPSMGL